MRRRQWPPASLFGRALVLIAVVVVLGQVSAALVFRHFIQKPRIEQLADAVAYNVEALVAALRALPPEQRQRFVTAFNDSKRLAPVDWTLHRSRPLAASSDAQAKFAQALSARLRSRGAAVVWTDEARSRQAIRLRVDGRDYWLETTSLVLARGLGNAWVAASVAIALLAWIGASLVHRRVNRPLTQLVEATEVLGRGGVPPRLGEDGPREIAAVARAFNHLGERLADQERERSLMLAGVSHDLRTPLTKLRLGMELMREQAEPELLASMERASDEMDAVIDQFLLYARPEDGEPAQRCDLNALAQSLVQDYARLGHPVHWEAGAVPPCMLRVGALRRALTNLLENAWRHGAAPVRLRTGAGDGKLFCEVADHGPGVAQDELEALKQPFRRGRASRGGAPGAGLGLAIVERVARLHGGVLVLDAPAGGGFIARLELPLTAGG